MLNILVFYFLLKIHLLTAQWIYAIHCIIKKNSCDKEIKFCVLIMLLFFFYDNLQTFRSNMTLTPHPDKEELIMFGGEFLTGSKVYSRIKPWFKLYTFVEHQFFYFLFSRVTELNVHWSIKISYCIDRTIVQRYLWNCESHLIH